MMSLPAPPPLPTRFPCWCRAVYSWGGESKRDLGFMEGDLIECLNAGDGSWWTGRLRRDRRMVGAFPSNFVEVLPEDFRPVSRTTSPLAPSNTPSPKNAPQKSKTFRKPFEAYAKAPHYTTAKQPETYMPGSERSRQTSDNSLKRTAAQSKTTHAPSPPRIAGYGSRAPSPAPSASFHAQPPPAPAQPYYQDIPPQRQPSPIPPPPPAQQFVQQPPQKIYQPYRAGAEASEPPPPAPPPHRHVLSRHGSNVSYNDAAPALGGGLERQVSNLSYMSQRSGGYHTPRVPSPCPPSPGVDGGLTPSPLREAMDGVIEQLDALGIPRDEPAQPEQSLDPWSPESFNMVHQDSRRKHRKDAHHMRPQTSMGLGHQVDEGYETFSGSGNSSEEAGYGYREDQQQLPQLSNYVERMESRLRSMHEQHEQQLQQHQPHQPHQPRPYQNNRSVDSGIGDDEAPPPPPKGGLYERPKSSMSMMGPDQKLRHRRSAYDVGRQVLGRTFTTKTNSTNTTQSTNHSLMSGVSAGGISATSAGSLARKNQSRAQSALGIRDSDGDRPETPFSGVTYHSSHASDRFARPKSQSGFRNEDLPGLGGMASLNGLTTPKSPKKGFFKKIIQSAKTSARTGVASSRGSIAMTGFGSSANGQGYAFPSPVNTTGISSASLGGGVDAAREMGLSSGVDWVQVRRDVNRSNSLSRMEKTERRDRCQMLDHPTLDPVDELYSTVQGDEGADGMPVENPTNYTFLNFSQVDKNSRFISSLPPMITAITLATTYVCRPYRSEVQRLRAIFTWVSEKIVWEDDYEIGSNIDTRRVIQTKRGCAEEYAVLVAEMCAAAGHPCEVVHGYLKSAGDMPELGIMPRPNHWWNAVLVDNEWRIMDCCLASPSFPRRAQYSSGTGTGTTADPWWFLVRPSEVCYTHIPDHHTQQHMCPPVAHEILLNLPCSGPPYFRNGLHLVDFNTSLMRIEDLEMVHLRFNVPEEVEVAAEVEVRALSRDADGDFFESGDVVKKRALAQADWVGGVKRYTVKALLPGDEGTGVLKVYAGRRGLMHSIKDIPHPLAFSLPIVHTGENPQYEFVMRHPTPHAQRHDIYVVQPQCQRLALNNTFVFAIRQHPSSIGSGTPQLSSAGGFDPHGNGSRSPVPFARPGSAMSMTSSAAGGPGAAGSVSGSSNSSGSGGGTIHGKKPAKLAIQTPGGKILRLMRKEDRKGAGGMGIGVGGRTATGGVGDEDTTDGGTWETIIKCSERGVWRGLVLADRTARWCVFAEWVCQ